MTKVIMMAPYPLTLDIGTINREIAEVLEYYYNGTIPYIRSLFFYKMDQLYSIMDMIISKEERSITSRENVNLPSYHKPLA